MMPSVSIDVIQDASFVAMDLHAAGRHDVMRFINLYIEQTGDYEGLKLLRLYFVPAGVRAGEGQFAAGRKSRRSPTMRSFGRSSRPGSITTLRGGIPSPERAGLFALPASQVPGRVNARTTTGRQL